MFDNDEDILFPEDDEEGEDAETANNLMFSHGCCMFLHLSQLLRKDKKSGNDLLKEMMKKIAGNRKDVDFTEIMPELFRKVVEHCHESLAMNSGPNDRL